MPMPLSLRIPPEKVKLIEKAAKKAGKTKSSFIIEAVDEKLGIKKDREQLIRDLAGWMTKAEARELKRNLEVFNKINDEDWN
jgi:predicted DNA-binding protein